MATAEAWLPAVDSPTLRLVRSRVKAGGGGRSTPSLSSGLLQPPSTVPLALLLRTEHKNLGLFTMGFKSSHGCCESLSIPLPLALPSKTQGLRFWRLWQLASLTQNTEPQPRLEASSREGADATLVLALVSLHRIAQQYRTIQGVPWGRRLFHAALIG